MEDTLAQIAIEARPRINADNIRRLTEDWYADNLPEESESEQEEQLEPTLDVEISNERARELTAARAEIACLLVNVSS